MGGAGVLIGELARRAGTSTRALRYYETHGLVQARRSSNGYRVYDDTEIAVVRQIRKLLAIGFSLDDIHPFVSCLRAGNDSGDVCPDSVQVLRRKIAEIDAGIDRLDGVRRQLRTQLDDAISRREQTWHTRTPAAS
jgi:DNA-binding transcriptional MerR regulator